MPALPENSLWKLRPRPIDEPKRPTARPDGSFSELRRMIYPQTNTKRLAVKLDGIWEFRKDPQDLGRASNWALQAPDDAIPMPVPAAFNEMTADPQLRDYFGAVWYFTTFDAPPASPGTVQHLRFGAAVHHAEVYLNGEKIGEEHLGKLPFDLDLTGRIHPAGNRLAVRLDTTLSWQTIPPGTVNAMGPTWSTPNLHGNSDPRPEYHFDFLNYGGLLRSVWLLSLPGHRIDALAIKTLPDGDRPIGLSVTAALAGIGADTPAYRLLDPTGACVATAGEGQPLRPVDPHPWSPEDPFLYTLEITLGTSDFYHLPVGLRTVRCTPDAFLLNGRPVYFKGCGLHEDFHLSGHGHLDTRLVKDLTLLKNMGANSFRTAHYPYDETAYQVADRLGLLVIDETAAVGLNAWDAYPVFTGERCNAVTRAQHQRVLELMIRRDHVHPSVVMWSIANEPSCHEPGAEAYFAPLFAAARAADPQRLPVTVVQSATPPGRHYASHHSRSAQFCDVILWNRYYAWYQDGGHPEDVALQVGYEAAAWREAFPQKPIMLAEFGADALAGQHSDPAVMFSEEYQEEIIRRYCEQLDQLPYVIGEHVWNLCDFMTKQGLTRVIGNRKGIHTRERQPKLAAHYLKRRWLAGKPLPAPELHPMEGGPA